MRHKLLLPFSLLACLTSVMAAVQTDAERAQDQLNRGIEAFKQYQYESATEHFRRAHELDPASHKAVLYLAMALAQEYVPGVDAPDNMRWAAEATENFKQVLEVEPQNVTALGWLGFIAMETRKYEEARGYYQQASQANPNDPEVPYAIGVIDWVQAYKRRFDERSKRGLSMGRPASITQPFCAKLRTDNLPLIEDGIQMMKKAIELRPDYDDAMAYLNLLYRERADVQCNNRAARATDLQQANQWVNKAMEARKKNAEASKDSQSPAAQSPESLLSAPPPTPPLPPPPPPPPPKRPIRVVH